MPGGSVLGPLLFSCAPSSPLYIVGNYIVGYADDTTNYAVIPRQLTRPQAMESLNRDLAATHSWCLKWYMRLIPRKSKSTVVSRSRIYASSYGNLALGGEELEEVKGLRIFGVTLDSKLTLETHCVVSKAAKSLGVVRRARKLFYCRRVLKSCFNAYVLPNLEYCAPV